jgi:glycosyltransferase involved in cell wall biosynthesis
MVSVIIPTYKNYLLIGRAIKSLLNQTYQNFEIVIVDDSPDNKTEEVVRGFKDERIKYIHNKERTNLPGARNQGVKESSPDSKYVAFLDDDDEYLPQFLEKTIKVLEEKREIAVVIPWAELRTKDGKKIGELKCSSSDEFWRQRVGNGCVIRKEIFTKENFWFDERKVMDDVDFALRVLKDHKWECLPEILWIYYPYPEEGKQSASSALPLKEIELFYEKHYSTFSKLGKRALGFFYNKVGREFLKSGDVKRGRENLLKALLTHPSLSYFIYYLASLILPRSFQKIKIRIIKRKLFRGII